MATGGTIPQDRKQYVTFYNTTGIIEKDKNIYFVPRFSKTARAGNFVLSEWRNAFNSVCPPASRYTDIEISSWSPQDRTLRVQGDIDDFRVITSEGSCLNYLIMRRRVKKTTAFIDSFYAFFITNAKQAGGSSVELTLEPDYFTNVFYLHNNHLLTADDVANDYEPFNERMKNCYVKRQHYNRLAVNEYYYQMSLTNLSSTPSFINIDDSISIYDDLTGTLLMSGYVNDYLIESATEMILTVRTETLPISITVPTIEIKVADNPYFLAQITGDSITRDWELANKKIFLNQEESFRYKYQYRDMKYPLSISSISNFTKSEINLIEANEDFDNLSSNLRKKIILACLAYEAIETKTYEGVAYAYEGPAQSTLTQKGRSAKDKVGSLTKPNTIIYAPFLYIPKQFKKYEEQITDYSLRYKFYNFYGPSAGSTFQSLSVEHLTKKVNEQGMADYILNAFVVNDVGFPLDKISIDTTSKYITFNLSVDYDFPDDVPYLSALYENMTYEGDPNYGIMVYIENNRVAGVQEVGTIYGFSIRNIYSRQYNISVEESITPSVLRNDYYDPVLEAEPYNFYSLSCLGFEMVFNKNRYFIDMKNTIIVDYTYSQNNATKLVFAPKYTVDDKTTVYYNEGMTFTLSSFLPIASSSYYSYYYQNMSQMKNQFAVNDYNRRTDLLQHFFISGPNAVGMSASKRGWVGALSETGNQVMQMVDEGIDWKQSNEVIEMNQQAMLADMGRKPDNLKQAGSDVYSDLTTGEFKFFLNHYTIDRISYNSIAKLLERVGYEINIYDTIHAVDRVGWNYVRLNNFDFETAKITLAEEQAIKEIFLNGVTLLHDQSYLTSGHNYETILEGGN